MGDAELADFCAFLKYLLTTWSPSPAKRHLQTLAAGPLSSKPQSLGSGHAGEDTGVNQGSEFRSRLCPPWAGLNPQGPGAGAPGTLAAITAPCALQGRGAA